MLRLSRPVFFLLTANRQACLPFVPLHQLLPLPIRTSHTAGAFWQIHQAGRGNGLLAAAAEAKVRTVNFGEGQAQAGQFAAGRAECRFRNAFIINGIHAADSADGIFRRDRLSGLFQAIHLMLHGRDGCNDLLLEYLSFLVGHIVLGVAVFRSYGFVAGLPGVFGIRCSPFANH